MYKAPHNTQTSWEQILRTGAASRRNLIMLIFTHLTFSSMPGVDIFETLTWLIYMDLHLENVCIPEIMGFSFNIQDFFWREWKSDKDLILWFGLLYSRLHEVCWWKMKSRTMCLFQNSFSYWMVLNCRCSHKTEYFGNCVMDLNHKFRKS